MFVAEIGRLVVEKSTVFDGVGYCLTSGRVCLEVKTPQIISIFIAVALIKIDFLSNFSKPVEIRIYHVITKRNRINGKDLFCSAYRYN